MCVSIVSVCILYISECVSECVLSVSVFRK